MKKTYIAPELSIAVITSDEKFALNCGIVNAPSNVEPWTSGCWMEFGEGAGEVANYSS